MDLVNDLLLFAKLESKKVVRKKEFLDMRKLSKAPRPLSRSRFRQRTFHFLSIYRKTALIRTDKAEMEQLLTNLVSKCHEVQCEDGKVTKALASSLSQYKRERYRYRH